MKKKRSNFRSKRSRIRRSTTAARSKVRTGRRTGGSRRLSPRKDRSLRMRSSRTRSIRKRRKPHGTYDNGYNHGYNQGYNQGFAKGYEEAMESSYLAG